MPDIFENNQEVPAAAPPPAWQMPAGVTGGLWDYLHCEYLARGYDRYLEPSPLRAIDRDFVLARTRPTDRVIDLGCGTGRHAIALARKGCEVVGVDLSHPMLRVATERCHAGQAHLSFLRANLVDLSCLRDEHFDAAICMFGTLGMISGIENRRSFLSETRRILKKSGRFLLHVHSFWHCFWTPGTRWWAFLQTMQSWRPGFRRAEYVMPTHQGIAKLSMYLFKFREIRSELRQAGFRVVDVQMVGPGPSGQVPAAWWFGGLRAQGFLIEAHRNR